jgi:glutamine amidotransferase
MLRSKPVTVVDHGAGNLHSVTRALTHVGANVKTTADPKAIASSERLLVPGQGAFADCLNRLRAGGLDDAIRNFIASGRPYFGICLGLQILFDTGHEHGEHDGLGILTGSVRRLKCDPGIKIPHMGWNTINHNPNSRLARAAPSGSWFYFVHSFVVHPAETEGMTCSTTIHGVPFVSAVSRENITACQFHPEKSQKHGLRLLEHFVGDRLQ